jgi:hypothetical protein
MKRFLVHAGAAVLLASPVLAQGPDVTGAWDVTTNSPQGTSQSVLTIKKDGGTLSGTIRGQRGERALDTVTVNGNQLKFTFKVSFNGQDLLLAYDATVEKDALKGTVDFGGFATGDWTAVRHVEGAAPAAAPAAPTAAAPAAPAAAPAAAPVTPVAAGAADITGTWQFNVTTDMGSGTPTFTLKQDGEKVSGNYKGQLGEAPVTGTVKGSDVRMSFKVNFQGQDVELVYTGKIQAKDAMQGTAKLGELGEATWTAKKQ